jgi:SAM-dependent methyltransferase
LYLAGAADCRVTGIDSDTGAIATATTLATRSSIADRVRFSVADANTRLPFDDRSFDAIVCIDAINHFLDRSAVLREWHRVLRGGGKVMFTDPVVITGPVTSEALALRSSIGFFLFVPPGVNEQFIENAELQLIRQEDVSENASLIANRWHQARNTHNVDLLRIEDVKRFDGLQRFFEAVHTLTSQRRLSRIAYLAQKRGD